MAAPPTSTTNSTDEYCKCIVANKYSLERQIGSGSFGVIYLAENIENGGQVAVKVEKSTGRRPQLPHEAKVYARLSGGVGIPSMHYYGVEQGLNVLVLELLGPSLEDLFNFCFRNFSIKTILMLGDQMIRRLEYLHVNFLIHRDVKPENFLMGLGNEKDKLFLIDFGLVKKYCDPNTKRHIDFRDNYELIGTARYASINAHMGIEQSRRDDMESIGYTLLYFYSGSLPWQGITASNKRQKYEMISEKKMSISLESLCQDAPFEFLMYMYYCRALHFVEQPDYGYLRQLFEVLFAGLNLNCDNVYDWNCIVKDDQESEQDSSYIEEDDIESDNDKTDVQE